MNLLLDTHVLLWALEGNPRLGAEARRMVVDGRNRVYVSAVSVWEIAIKRSLGKITVPDTLLKTITSSGFSALPITLEHADAVSHLPLWHQDPFDRLLIAQAQQEQMTLVTHDAAMLRYEVSLMRIG